MDVQSELRDAAGLTALVHCLARLGREEAARRPAEALRWSAFRAARDGLDAELLAPDGSLRPLRVVAARALDAPERSPASSAPTGRSRRSSACCARAAAGPPARRARAGGTDALVRIADRAHARRPRLTPHLRSNCRGGTG